MQFILSVHRLWSYFVTQRCSCSENCRGHINQERNEVDYKKGVMLLSQKCLPCKQTIRKLYYMIHHWLKSSYGKLKQNTVRVVCQTFSNWHFCFEELCNISVYKKRWKETSFTEVISYCTRYGVIQVSYSKVKESYLHVYGNVLLF